MTRPSPAPATEATLFTARLGESDPEIADVIRRELERQRDEIELIASENIVSAAVLEAQGSVLTNKYAEGLPGRRYYGGCEFVDIAETVAIERVTRLFGCKFANVQPHSGASANAAAFMALMAPGDTFMGLSLPAGGHLTHGSPVSMSGRWFKPVAYSVRRDDHRIDVDEVVRLAREQRPRVIVPEGAALQRRSFMHVIAAKAVPFGEALRPSFKVYARNVIANAKALAESLKSNGLDIVSGGTDTHLMLVDLRPKRLTGKVAEAALGRAHITCNKNGIPFDPEKPAVTSGVRLGTPAGTTRGFGIGEFQEIGELIVEVLDALSSKGVEADASVEAAVRAKVKQLVGRFPIY